MGLEGRINALTLQQLILIAVAIAAVIVIYTYRNELKALTSDN